MTPDAASEQKVVTEDVDRVLRLGDLKVAGVLTPDEQQFIEMLEAHRIGSAIGHEVLSGVGAKPAASSQHLTLDEVQRQLADAILTSHGG